MPAATQRSVVYYSERACLLDSSEHRLQTKTSKQNVTPIILRVPAFSFQRFILVRYSKLFHVLPGATKPLATCREPCQTSSLVLRTFTAGNEAAASAHSRKAAAAPAQLCPCSEQHTRPFTPKAGSFQAQTTRDPKRHLTDVLLGTEQFPFKQSESPFKQSGHKQVATTSGGPSDTRSMSRAPNTTDYTSGFP